MAFDTSNSSRDPAPASGGVIRQAASLVARATLDAEPAERVELLTKIMECAALELGMFRGASEAAEVAYRVAETMVARAEAA